MREIQKILAWGCVLLLVISGVTALFLFNIERRAFSAETYKQAFEKQGLYVRMPAIMAETIHTSITQDASSDPFLKVLTRADWEASIANILPPDELKIISNNALDSVFAYLNNETNSASISLILLKARIAGPQGAETVLHILNAQPACSLEQLMQMGLGFLSGEVILCKPPEEMMGLVTPLIETQLQVITRSIPDEVTLISSEGSSSANDSRMRLNTVRTVMKWTPIFPFLFLIGVTVFAVRNLTDWLKWWGYPFLIMGVTGMFLSLIGSPILGLVIQGMIQKQAGSLLPPILIPLMGETVSVVAGQILIPVTIEGLILGILGSGMVLTEYLLKKTILK